MPATSTAINPSGIQIEFNEFDHSYKSIIDGQELNYISVTTLIHKYFPEFDPTGEITKRCALKEGITVEELKAKWEQKKQNSCTFGTRVHEICEDVELGREKRNTPVNQKEIAVFAQAENIALKFRNSLNILGVEKLVFDPSLKIAGTIDLFGQSRKDGTYLIIDHKTNEKIETENKYNSFGKKPIENIPNINYHIYALQLNLYEYLLKYGNYVPKDAKFKLILNHLTETENKLIQLPDYQTEIRELLINYLITK